MKKTLRRIALLAAGFAALGLAQAARAGVVVLTFEGLQDEESINDFYNGGTGSLGSVGPNYGISFTSDSLSIISKFNGGTGNFHGALAPTPNTIAFFLTGGGDTMNVAAGFDTGFSFFYTSPFFVGTVTVWDGLDGTGTQLASLTLGLTMDTRGTTGEAYDDWKPIGVSFKGTAKSAIFSGVANQIAFDNITLGASTPVGAPDGGATIALLGLALIGLVTLRRMR